MSVEATVRGPKGQATLDFLVDSGAKYSLIPAPIWTELGLEAMRTMRFRLADGSAIERQISECEIYLPDVHGHTPVILGEPGDEPLLGVVTLENLGLILNPFNRTLQPAQMMLA